MRAADPCIKIGAILDENYGASIPHAYSTWSEEVLPLVGQEVDFVSIHNGYAPAVVDPGDLDLETIYAAMLAAPVLIESSLERVSGKIQRLVPDRASEIKIAITEWGPFFHLVPESPYVDHIKTLGSGLYVASVLKMFIQSPQVEIANFFKLADALFMGWIGPRQGQWVPKAPYYAFQMYTQHFGEVLVQSETTSPAYKQPCCRLGRLRSRGALPGCRGESKR